MTKPASIIFPVQLIDTLEEEPAPVAVICLDAMQLSITPREWMHRNMKACNELRARDPASILAVAMPAVDGKLPPVPTDIIAMFDAVVARPTRITPVGWCDAVREVFELATTERLTAASCPPIKVKVCRWLDDGPHSDVDVNVINVDALGGLYGAMKWLDLYSGTLDRIFKSRKFPILVAAVRTSTGDATALSRRVSAMVVAPAVQIPEAWANAVRPELARVKAARAYLQMKRASPEGDDSC